MNGLLYRMLSENQELKQPNYYYSLARDPLHKLLICASIHPESELVIIQDSEFLEKIMQFLMKEFFEYSIILV